MRRDAMKDEIGAVVSGDLCQGMKALIWGTAPGSEVAIMNGPLPAPSAPLPSPRKVAGEEIRQCVTQHFFFSLSLSVGHCLLKKKLGLPF